MAVGTIMGLLSLLLALGSSGVNVAKGVKSKGEGEKIKSNEKDYEREQKKIEKNKRRDAIRNILASQMNSGIGNIPRDNTNKVEPYEAEDLSGYDIASGVLSGASSLAGQASNFGKEPDSNIETASGNMNDKDLAMKKQSKYGNYLSSKG